MVNMPPEADLSSNTARTSTFISFVPSKLVSVPYQASGAVSMPLPATIEEDLISSTPASIAVSTLSAGFAGSGASEVNAW